MPRYIREEYINKPVEFVEFIMKDFLQKHGFSLNEVNGEQVYQNGVGMLTIPKFFKYGYMNGVIHLEAWTRTAWLPGVYGKKENDLSGYVGTIPKQAYKNDIEELIKVLYQPLPSDSPYQNLYQGQQNGPIVVQGVDTKNLATIGFVFSLLSIPLCFLSVYFGFMLALIGTPYCYKSLNSSKRGLANVGFVLGVIGLILSLVCILSLFVG